MDHQHTAHALGDRAQLDVTIAAATRHARRLARGLVLAEADLEDFRQAILVAILTRSARHDPQRGSWATFVGLIARHAAIDLARACRGRLPTSPVETFEDVLADPAAGYPEPSLDLRAALATLPPSCRRLVALIAETGSLADARRASTMSSASFYRHVHDLRLRLLMAGLGTTAWPQLREKDRPCHPYKISNNRKHRASRRETVCPNGESSS